MKDGSTPRKALAGLALAAVDAGAVFACYLAAYAVRVWVLPRIEPDLAFRTVVLGGYVDVAWLVLFWLAAFSSLKLYSRRFPFWEELRRLWIGTSVASVAVVIVIFMAQAQNRYSRLVIVLAWLISFALLPLARIAIKRILFAAGLWQKRVVIAGPFSDFSAIVDAVRHSRISGFVPVGLFSDDGRDVGKSVAGVKVLDHLDNIEAWKGRTEFEDIIVNLPESSAATATDLLRRWDVLGETIRYIPAGGDLFSADVETANIGPLFCLLLRKNLIKPWNRWTKEALDAGLGIILVAVLAPVFLLVSLAVALDSRGPVFFLQERFGRKGRLFRLVKFRSMYLDADERLARRIECDEAAREDWRVYKKIKNGDPRITRVGRVLRKFSLDELPQLFNVLRGEMSLVGPRPYLAEELAELERAQRLLLQIRPGITGLWQVSGRSLLPFSERLKLDEYYLRNWTFWLDFVILMRTFRVWLSGRGAF
jgi:undecaprenyl-phosphate galactose phosphotransferase